jgi:pimeloyl-ACP methyl ester carboxylesterase
MADAFDATMGACILELYRGAVPPALRELADRLAAAEPRPALIIDATEDAYVGSALVPDVAERFGADVVTLEGHGHWWMASAPGAAAAGLAAFWDRIGG